MNKATLDGIRGAGEVRIRRRSETSWEYRGVFAFRAEDEAALVKLLASRDVVEYEGIIDGELSRLKVRVTDMSRTSGVAAFQGIGEPYGDTEETRAG